MKDFLLENYSWISTLLFGLVSVLVFVFKKVKVVKKDTAFEKILDMLPELINKAESSGKSGIQKKDFVLWSAMSILYKLMDEQMSVDESELYRERISDAIENILSTPKKKEKIDEK